MIGYFLYSTRSLEPEYMKQIVETAVNKHRNAHKHGQRLELGFRWQVIPTSKQGAMKEEERVRALHIECPSDQFQVSKAILSDLYSANTKAFPGNIKM